MRFRAPLLFSSVLVAGLPVRASAQSADVVVHDAGPLSPSERLNARLAPDRRQPELPELVKRGNGTWTYEGKGFDATIERDGTVRMRDRFVRVRFGFFPRRDPINREWSFSFFEIKLDIFGWLDKKIGKNDPYRSERHWFLAGTFDLRLELAAKAAQNTMRDALNGIWKRVGLSLAERKRLTFALWDDSSEDEFGEIGRAQVIAFVREHCPQDGGRGFSAEDLAALNAKQRSKRTFTPYQAP